MKVYFEHGYADFLTNKVYETEGAEGESVVVSETGGLARVDALNCKVYTGPVPAGYILWDGGECPVDGGVMVEVFCRGGSASLGPLEARFYGGHPDCWKHVNDKADIIAYRIVEEDKEVEEAQDHGELLKLQARLGDTAPDIVKPEAQEKTEKAKQKKYDAMPDRLKRLAVHELITDIDDLDNRHDAFDVAKQLEQKGYAMDEQCVKDLSEYLQSIAK